MALTMKHANATCASRPVAGSRVAVARQVAGRRVSAAQPCRRVALKAQAESQTTAAEARWEAQIKEGRVVNVSTKDIKLMMQEGWTLLDVRSPGEANKVPIVGAVNVPLFKEDESMSVGALLAKWAHFGTGGWWVGGTHMVANQSFIQEVQAQVPKGAKIVVACQKGLRSLAACEQLSRAGYSSGLAWINGGLDTARKGDLDTKDGVDVRYAGVGGLSEVLGWTEVQQEEKKELLGGAQGVINIFIGILAIDLLLFVYEAADAYMKTGSIAGIAPM